MISLVDTADYVEFAATGNIAQRCQRETAAG